MHYLILHEDVNYKRAHNDEVTGPYPKVLSAQFSWAIVSGVYSINVDCLHNHYHLLT